MLAALIPLNEILTGLEQELELVLRLRLQLAVVDNLSEVLDDALLLAVMHDSLDTHHEIVPVSLLKMAGKLVEEVDQRVGHRWIVLARSIKQYHRRLDKHDRMRLRSIVSEPVDEESLENERMHLSIGLLLDQVANHDVPLQNVRLEDDLVRRMNIDNYEAYDVDNL